MATATITLKTDTTANWESSNRILALNEPALERTTDGYINMKLGDGVTPWTKLGYVFKLKTLEDLNASATSSSSSAAEQVTLAKAELAKCVSEYDKTKEIADGFTDKINLLSTNAENATTRANNAAAAAEAVTAEKIGIDDNKAGAGTTYSSNKIESMLKVLNTNRPKEWGVRFPLYTVGSNPKGERLGDAIGLVANVGTDSATAYNDFDYLMPWKSRRVNGHWDGKDFVVTAVEGEPNFAVDGSNGGVYAERHLFYYKYVFTDTYYEIWISDQHLDGYEIPERFVNVDKSIMQTYYYPCYKISRDASGNPLSISGANTMLTLSYSGYKTLARKLGTNFHIETTKDRQINELLFYVEFATRDSQSIMYGAGTMRYNADDLATVATTSGNKFICSNAVAGNYVVGQTIVIGSTKNGSEIANNRRITSIETYDASNKAIVFDGAAVRLYIPPSHDNEYPQQRLLYASTHTVKIGLPTIPPYSFTRYMSHMVESNIPIPGAFAYS